MQNKNVRTEYERIHFYGRNDWATGLELEKCAKFLESFDALIKYSDVNDILELYNVYRLIDSEMMLKEWTVEYHSHLKGIAKPFMQTIAQFFAGVDDYNFIKQEKTVTAGYYDDFWRLFVKFKVYSRISENVFSDYLHDPFTTLYKLLEYKELVYHYDSLFTDVLRTSNQTAEILISKFFKNKSVECYLPKSFRPEEFEEILLRYVYSDEANANDFDLIYYAQNSGECPVSDDLKLAAKRAKDEFWEKHQEDATKTEYGIGVSFVDQKELRRATNDGLKYLITYDIKWLEENLDYPTILNNFRYVFEMVDSFCRCTLVSISSQLGTFERAFRVDGVKFYQTGYRFELSQVCSISQMGMYYKLLKNHGIEIEEVFKWFFEEYIVEEFGIKGFSYCASTSTSSFVEKCKNIVSEMDGVLKQFRMYVRKGYIDQELFEISSEHIVLGDVPSLIPSKYAYADSVEIKNEMFAMFSDQSMLSYTEKTKSTYTTLTGLVANERISLHDFPEYQRTRIEWLIKRGSIIVDNGFLKLNFKRVILLKDIYDHEVTCPYYFDAWGDYREMFDSGDLAVSSSLFSVPEKNYLNFELNKAEFSNGLDLRNKYSHGTYRKSNEFTNENDYYRLLNIMVFIVSKINDELCFAEKQGSDTIRNGDQ
jgi:hypothetical protein